MERFLLPLGAWDGLRYFIVALPEPSINYSGVSDMEDNVTDEDSRSRRYAVIPRTRGGLKTRGGVRTRGGMRNSTPNACASQSLFALQ